MRYKKAPILEAVLEFRWTSTKSLEDLTAAIELPLFGEFEEPKPRHRINASVDIKEGAYSEDRKHIGYEVGLKDGSELVFLEEEKFVFIQRAPYDTWEYFSNRALGIFEPVREFMDISELSRVGTRFVNRIDIPLSQAGNFDTDEYIAMSFDGPRNDIGVVDEFQMRIVKPITEDRNVLYALTVAVSPSPLKDHGAIILDIDVFSRQTISTAGDEFVNLLSKMHEEKNDIFEACITDKTRELFGGEE